MEYNYTNPQDISEINDLALFEAHEIESALAMCDERDFYQSLDEGF